MEQFILSQSWGGGGCPFLGAQGGNITSSKNTPRGHIERVLLPVKQNSDLDFRTSRILRLLHGEKCCVRKKKPV